MNKKESQFTYEMIKEYLVVSFIVILLWQIYQVIHIFKVAPIIKGMLDALGLEPIPKITAIYINYYGWFIILPVITLILTVDLIRRKRIPKVYSLTVFGSIGLITLILQVITREAFFQPMLVLIEKIAQ